MATIGGYNITTDGLVLSLDAANPRSYVSGSTIWRDLTINNNGATLTNISNANQSLSFITASSIINVTNLTNQIFSSASKNFSIFFTAKEKQSLTSVSVSTFENTYTYNLNQQNIEFNTYTFNFQQQNTNIVLNAYLNAGIIIAENSTISTTMLGSSYNINIKTTNDPNPAYISQIYIYNKILQQFEITQNYNAIKNRFL